VKVLENLLVAAVGSKFESIKETKCSFSTLRKDAMRFGKQVYQSPIVELYESGRERGAVTCWIALPHRIKRIRVI